MNNDRLPFLNNRGGARSDALERFSDAEMGEIKRGFVRRLKIAFDDLNNADIARRCKTHDSTIKLYTDGERLPIAEMLLQMHRVTGINLHWLLTGKGSRRVGYDNLFSEEEEARISELARERGISFEEMVRKLTLAGAEFLDNSA